MKTKTLLALVTILVLCGIGFLPAIQQSEDYHNFANHSPHWGIANFWNVISNLPFLLVAIAAWPRRGGSSSKLTCFRILLIGVALTTFGSAYYHAQPSDARLVWDRLPMTIVFMSILTLTIDEQIDARLARRLLFPLLILGVFSVVYWRYTGDLRLYVAVQFYPLIALPIMLSPPAKNRYAWAMIAAYTAAKLFELFDRGIPGGGHAWKHLFAALGLFLYARSMRVRLQVDSDRASPTDTPSGNFAKRTSLEPLGFSKR